MGKKKKKDKHKKKWEDVTVKKLRKLCVIDELSVSQIAEKYGVSETEVYERLKGIEKKEKEESAVSKDAEEKTDNDPVMPEVMPDKENSACPDKEELYRLYVEENKPAGEVAAIYGVAQKTVHKWLRKNNIPVRYKGPSAEEIRRLYVDERMTYNEIAKATGVSMNTIKRRMHDVGPVPKRRRSACPGRDELYRLYVEENKTAKEIAGIYSVSYSTASTWLLRNDIKKGTEDNSLTQRKLKGPSIEEVRHLYVDEKMSRAEIAKATGVSADTIRKRMRDGNIPARSVAEAQKERFKKANEEHLTGIPVEKIKYLYTDEHLPIKTVAEKCGLSYSQTHKILKDEGVVMREPGKRRRSKNPGYDTLHRLYIEEGKTSVQIAEIYGVRPKLVRYWLTKYGIRKNTGVGGKYHPNPNKPDAEGLRRMYVDQDMTIDEIAEKCGATSNTVQFWLSKAGVKKGHGHRQSKKPPYEELHRMYIKENMSAGKIAEKFGVCSSAVYRWLREEGISRKGIKRQTPEKKKSKRPDKNPGKEELERLYIAEGKSIKEVGEACGVSRNTAWKWLKEAGIRRRNSRPAKNPGKEELERLCITEGKNIEEIAKLFGVSYNTAWKWIKNAGISMKHWYTSQNPGRKTLEQLFADGMSVQAIAAAYCVNENTVWYWCRKEGISHKTNRSKNPGADKLRQLYLDEDLNRAEIAEKYGVSETSVSNWLKDAGIKKPVVIRNPKIPCPDESELKKVFKENGGTIKCIARYYGVSLAVARRWAASCNISSTAPTAKSKMPGRETLYDLYILQNHSIHEISRMYGVTEVTVVRWTRKAGIRKTGIVKCKSKPSKNPGKDILYDLYIARNHTIKEIAEMYNVSINTVPHWLSKYDIRKYEEKEEEN